MLKKIFKTSTTAAFSGGLIFVLSFYVTIQGGDISSLPGKLLLPWIVLCVIGFIKRKTWLNYLLLVFVNYIIFALGYPYNYVYFDQFLSCAGHHVLLDI
jgi:Flp pilus assembly protein TadB